MACGIFVSSVKFSGQTCQVTFLEDGTNQTYLLGDETIPFTFFPSDGTPQGTYFIYFSGSDTTYPLIVSGECPTPTPTPTLTNTPTPTVTIGLTPTSTQTPTYTPTPTKTPSPRFQVYVSNSSGYDVCSSSLLNLKNVYTLNGTTSLSDVAINNLVLYNYLGQIPLTGYTYITDSINYYTMNSSTGKVNNNPISCVLPTTTPTVTPSNTPTPNVTPTPTVTIGLTPTATESSTPTPTVTKTPTVTPSNTPTNSVTPTVTPTVTSTTTPTNTPTFTPTPTKTVTPTKTNTPTPTPTKNYTGCEYYQLDNDSTTGNVIYSYINCGGILVSGNLLPPNPSVLLCAKKGSIVRTGGIDSLVIIDLGLCPSQTPTPTVTNTPTPTI